MFETPVKNISAKSMCSVLTEKQARFTNADDGQQQDVAPEVVLGLCANHGDVEVDVQPTLSQVHPTTYSHLVNGNYTYK